MKTSLETILPGELRERLERSLGADIGAVRVRTGPIADFLCRHTRASAVTIGDTIWFSKGALNVSTDVGRWLLAHELIHVLQNRLYPSQPRYFLSGEADESEREAYALAERVLAGERVTVRATPQAWMHSAGAP